jgi:hypothetical protein
MDLVNPFYKNNDAMGAVNKIITNSTEMWMKVYFDNIGR